MSNIFVPTEILELPCHVTMEIVYILFILELKLVCSFDEWVTAPQIDEFEDGYEYILYDKDATWNDAARICAKTGGRPLTIQSQEKADLIEEYKKDEWAVLKDHDYWIGMTEPEERVFVWADCYKSTLATYQNFKSESYNDNELCYKVKHDSLEWESKGCHEKHRVVCEKVIAAGCGHENILSSNRISSNSSNMTVDECKDKCRSTPECWAGISLDSGKCILLQTRTSQEPLTDIVMFEKICSSVLYKGVDETPQLPDENTERIPILNCTAGYIDPVGIAVTAPVVSDTTTSATTATTNSDTTASTEDVTANTISPSPCVLYDTINVTNMYNETYYETVNVTNIVNQTEIYNVTETVVVTSMALQPTSHQNIYSTVRIETLTISINSTYSVTETFNVTYTNFYNISDTVTETTTVTETSGACQSANHTYLSSDDPRLASAIASIKKELTVDKKKTNAAIRKLTSAPDNRSSSQAIGATGIAIIVLIFSVVLIADFPRLLTGIKRFFNRFRTSKNYTE